ncbi:hypothetical protein I3U72_13535 [Mycobacteroides abscessus subsp. abscessus]|uniref:hypothetical protein n=1 Tax=Mycobacteroides abscessus TaxID=36809 RepID=UPI0019D17C31|nr:hypothetical protein [Mycobacteroides abscessus]MBN7327387.1 hypothetical protein [Mycobacteroides abscessus subsp. abscessus]
MRAWVQKIKDVWRDHRFLIVVSTAALGILFSTVSLLKTFSSDVDWGNFPEYIAAIGTTGALLISIAVWRHEVEKRHKEDQRRDEADHRAQAERISAWFETPGKLDPQGIIRIGLSNASPGVVYEVQLHVQCKSTALTSSVAAALPKFNKARGYLPMLGPGEWVVHLPLANIETMEPKTIDIWFRDQQGTRWHRTASSLTPDASPPFKIPGPLEVVMGRALAGVFGIPVHALEPHRLPR